MELHARRAARPCHCKLVTAVVCGALLVGALAAWATLF